MNAPSPIDKLDTRLKALCDTILKDTLVPGASIAILAGGTGYHYAYGIKSISSNEPVTIDTAFNIASCTKAFTSATVASLVADGLVMWDDPVINWVPELELYDPEITKRVTLRDLSANRLGLPRAGLTEFGLNPNLPAEHIFRRLKHTPAAYPFRDRFSYINAGHTINAVAAGRITGKGFLNTLRERILLPIGMAATSGGAVTPQELTNLAAWHRAIDDRVFEIDSVFTDHHLGASGIVLSGRDSLQWLRLHLGGGLVDGKQVINREALLETHRPHVVAIPGKDPVSLFYPDAYMAAYALGWGVSDLHGHPLIMHSGSENGVSAMTMLLPRDGIGIAVYCNCNGGGPGALSLAHALAATLLGQNPRDWLAYFQAAVAIPPESSRPDASALTPDLTIYEGKYEHPADGVLEIWIEDGQLMGRMKDAYRLEFSLQAAEEHVFSIAFVHREWQVSSAFGPAQLTFTVKNGRSVSVEGFGPFKGRLLIRVMPVDSVGSHN